MTLESRLLGMLRQHRTTLACAESMTGGLFAARLSRESGASEWFLGGSVVYTDGAKQVLAGIDRALLEKEGGVSAPVARDLARNTRERLGADLAVSIVGFAGPRVPPGGRIGKTFIALARAGGVDVHELQLPGDRHAVRETAVDEAMRFVLEAVEKAKR
ncbi:MAG TPA: CinA family protein [Candidatus Thermoplasmatota archaeon]|nr:CinA family protein [Candidatus Thermoplasmatota archaeon]